MSDRDKALAKIEAATVPQDLFANGDSLREYRRLALLVHPDTSSERLKDRTTAAFSKLADLYSSLTNSLDEAEHVKIGKWSISAPFSKGDIADLYSARSGDTPAVLKLARDRENSDLMTAEADSLRKIRKCTQWQDEFGHYVPDVLESLSADGKRVNVLSRAAGCSLPEIQAAFPDGLDFRHVVWMMNRLLSAIGYAHYNGIVHGAVLPDHLIYEAENHHLVLVDWCYSVPVGRPAKAVIAEHKGIYPAEVLRKNSLLEGTDIFMAAKALKPVAATIPRRFRPLFDWCLTQSPSSRPRNALDLKNRWVELAEEEYGPPRFIPLEIPIQ